jgi:hypothetical protein
MVVQDTLKEQEDVINEQQHTIDSQKAAIKELQDTVGGQSLEVTKLQQQLLAMSQIIATGQPVDLQNNGAEVRNLTNVRAIAPQFPSMPLDLALLLSEDLLPLYAILPHYTSNAMPLKGLELRL